MHIVASCKSKYFYKEDVFYRKSIIYHALLKISLAFAYNSIVQHFV